MGEEPNPDGEEVVDSGERREGGRRCPLEDASGLRVHLRRRRGCGRHGARRGSLNPS
jgi:hypothetical protein